MSLLNREGTRMASVIADEDSGLLEITRSQFDDLLSHHPMTAYEMVRVMSTIRGCSRSPVPSLTIYSPTTR
jgi:CRP-like cAMP-binding protein